MASGTNAAFYSIINLAQAGDNIVSARNLYGGTYTQFKDILPTLGITVKFVDSNSPSALRRRRRRQDAGLLHGDRQQPCVGRGRHQGYQ